MVSSLSSLYSRSSHNSWSPYSLVGHVDGESKALVALGLQHVDGLLVASRVDVPCHHLGAHLCISVGRNYFQSNSERYKGTKV